MKLFAGRVSSRRLCLLALILAVPFVAPLGRLSAEPDAAPSGADISGCWTCGSWLSCCNGHHGKLRAKIVPCGCHYQCQFSGTFFKIIGFRYSVNLEPYQIDDGIVYFRASKNIPVFGGTFSCCGYATNCKFHATYQSKKDHGTFDMSR